MPSRGFINHANSPKIISPIDPQYVRGADWHKETSSLEDVEYLLRKLDKLNLEHLRNQNVDSTEAIMVEYIHVGSVVGSVIDGRTKDLDARLKNIQSMNHEFHLLMGTENPDEATLRKLELDITEQSLSLGYDLQQNTQGVLADLGITGNTIDPGRIKGNKYLSGLIVKYSGLFPQKWNEKIIKYRTASFVTPTEGSGYQNTRKWYGMKREINITMGKDGAYALPDFASAKKEAKNNPTEYTTRHEIVHEMSHMYEEGSSDIASITSKFLEQRITDGKGNTHILSKYYENIPDRHIYADSFSNTFMGTVYGSKTNYSSNEIFARGTESVLLGSNGSLIGLPQTGRIQGGKDVTVENVIPDIQYRNLILGILAGAKLDRGSIL